MAAVVCERFDVTVEVRDGVVYFAVSSDLPEGTRVLFGASRWCPDSAWLGPTRYLVLDSHGGVEGSFSVAAFDRDARAHYRRWGGLSGSVSEELRLMFMASAEHMPGRQLMGSQVLSNGGISFVRCQREVVIPVTPGA